MIHEFETTILKTFVTVSETRNFSAAAQMLHRTQPAVSQQIKKLEENVKRKLFARGGNTVELTAEGEMLLKFAREIVALSETARHCMAMQLPTEQISVGAPDDYLHGFLQGPLTTLAMEHPDVCVSVTCGNSSDLVHKWERGEIDMCIVATDPDRDLGTTLHVDELVWTASDSWPMKRNILPLAGFPKGCHVRSAMISALDLNGLPWRFVFSSDCISAIHRHVLEGRSVTAFERSLMPSNAVDLAKYIELPALSPIRIALLARTRPNSEIQERLKELITLRFSEVVS